jgi:hypothetical protein
MRKLLEIAKFTAAHAAIGAVCLRDATPDIVALARQLADTVPGCWSSWGDHLDGRVVAMITLSAEPHVSVSLAIEGIRRPLKWTNRGHIERMRGEKAAGDLILAVCAAEDSAAAVVLTAIDDSTDLIAGAAL